MNILIDTHIAIWAMINRKKLTNDLINDINNLNNQIYVSIISVWEVAIKNMKYGIDGMPLTESMFAKYCEEMEFELLPIKIKHISNIRNLKIKNDKIIHKDPFDKMLISQSICENLTFCTRDSVLLNYDVPNIKIV